MRYGCSLINLWAHLLRELLLYFFPPARLHLQRFSGGPSIAHPRSYSHCDQGFTEVALKLG